MYNIWMRNYPQVDVNISEELELGPKTLKEAGYNVVVIVNGEYYEVNDDEED